MSPSVMGSGAKSGSSLAEASARCRAAVAAPRRASMPSVAGRRAPSPSASSVHSQPSRAPGISVCTTASVKRSPSPRSYTTWPQRAGTWGKRARSVRNRPISCSGFSPAARRRKCLRIRLCPKATEVLLCSPPSRRGVTSAGSDAGKAVVGVPRSSPRPPPTPRPRRTRSSSAWQNAGSSSASWTAWPSHSESGNAYRVSVPSSSVTRARTRLAPPTASVSSMATPAIRRVLVANHRRPATQAASASDGGVLDPIARWTTVGVVEPEPVEAGRTQRQEVRLVAHGRKACLAEQLEGHGAPVTGEVETHRLRASREVGDDEDRLVTVRADEGEHALVERAQELDPAAAEGRTLLARGDEPPHGVQERGRRLHLRFDVDGLVAVDGVADHRAIEPALVGGRDRKR